MAASVATPLEQQFSSIAGISSMNSTSSLGQSQITLQFDLSRDIDGAAQDVQAAIAAAARHIYAFVGIILLIGIVKKNGMMMIDFAVEARKEGKSAHDAIYEACLVRFRPIMMTTMAALMERCRSLLVWVLEPMSADHSV